jgi:hypothetical protein
VAAVVQREEALEDGGGAFDDVTGKLVASLVKCLLRSKLQKFPLLHHEGYLIVTWDLIP